jgi:hypothetical protein
VGTHPFSDVPQDSRGELLDELGVELVVGEPGTSRKLGRRREAEEHVGLLVVLDGLDGFDLVPRLERLEAFVDDVEVKAGLGSDETGPDALIASFFDKVVDHAFIVVEGVHPRDVRRVQKERISSEQGKGTRVGPTSSPLPCGRLAIAYRQHPYRAFVRDSMDQRKVT